LGRFYRKLIKTGIKIDRNRLGQNWGEIGADFGGIEFKIMTGKAG